MPDFLGASEITARADMIGLDNKLQEARLEAIKTEGKDGRAKEIQQLKDVSLQFESIFLSYMLKQMRKTVPDDPLFGKSAAKDIYYGMYDDSVAKELSRAGGIGLAAILYKQLSSMPSAAAQVPGADKNTATK